MVVRKSWLDKPANFVDFIQFNTEYVNSVAEGRLQWNAEDGTLELGLEGGTVVLQIGQEQLVRCWNNTGNPIPDGKAVYVTGVQGERPTIALASAATGAGNVPIGVTTELIADGAQGYVNVGGLVRDIDTSNIAPGGIAFLDESSPGEFRATPPAAPNFTTVCGYCIKQNATEGVLFVRILSAPRLQSLSDVDHTAPSDKEFYRWNNSNGRFELVTDASIDVDLIPTAKIGTPTYPNLDDRLNAYGGAGRHTGGIISDGGSETINVTAGTGFIKATDDDTAELLAFDWAAGNGLAIPTNTLRYVGVNYNTGTPIVEVRETENWDLDTEFALGSIVNEGGTLHILNNPWWVTDGITNIIERFQARGHFVRDDHIGGLVLSAPATRRIAVSAGVLWARLNEFAISEFTSVGDAGSFEAYWRNSSGVWTEADLYQYSVLLWNDITEDALQNIQANRYCNIWVYIEVDDDEISILYPQEQHVTAAGAEAEAPPTVIPTHIREHGILIGRIIIQYNTDAPIDIQSVWGTVFTGSAATDHGNLAGLTDDDHPQYMLNAEVINQAIKWALVLGD